MPLIQTAKDICRLYNIIPSHSKGQNFLVEEKVYDDIIEAAQLTKDDIVLEVGPGLGFLTARLAKEVKKVIAVELDDKLVEVLRTGLKTQNIENVEVINQDVLNFNIKEYLAEKSEAKEKIESKEKNSKSQVENFKYKIVANLPYNITSIFLRTFLSSNCKPECLVLMLQKEVVERIIAKAPHMSLLALSVQLFADGKMIRLVSADAFWPQPEVASAVIRLDLLKQARFNPEQEKKFFKIAHAAYAAKRKMLKNNLANLKTVSALSDYAERTRLVEKVIQECGFNPKIRAQELSVDDWLILFAKFSPLVV
jgi:16S rRNA (adenine1518-N6/adenine1519-N6)-dimethyltransferase